MQIAIEVRNLSRCIIQLAGSGAHPGVALGTVLGIKAQIAKTATSPLIIPSVLALVIFI